MYRFLLSPRWILGALLAVVAAMAMVLLGNWQLSRYHERSALNERIDAGERAAPVPVADLLGAPAGPNRPGAAPAADRHWARVTLTGHYDVANEVLVRGRTLDSEVGYEVVTPLIQADGTAMLVDRGWVPPAPGGAMPVPQVPAAPTGQVSVIGRIHPSESTPGPVDRRDGRIQVRRISIPQLAGQIPYPLYGAYVLLTEQTPAADQAFRAIPVERENELQNGGYAIQWWVFAAMALAAYVWLARREAHGATGPDRDRAVPVGAGPAG